MDEVDVTTNPSGYVLVRKEDGVYAFLKIEPGDEDQMREEIIEEVYSEDLEMEVEGDIEEEGGQMGKVVEELVIQEEIDIDDIPDVIEEDRPTDSKAVCLEQDATYDQVAFIEDVVNPPIEVKKTSPKILHQKKPTIKPKAPSTYSSHTWKGISLPPHLKGKELEKFKQAHMLERLSIRVKRNRQKVLIFGNKNESLRKLIANQQSQMMKMGFHSKDISRFHKTNKKPEQLPPSISPVMDKEFMTDKEEMEFKKRKLEADYVELRRRLKSLLSSHRRYKKIFVTNHEKILKGPVKRDVFQSHAHLMELASADDSDSEEDGEAKKTFRCYHCNYRTDTKTELRIHIEGHLTLKRYECPVCPYITPKITPFLEHMKEHPGAKAFSCKTCSFKSAYPAAMRNHELTHLLIKPLKCTHCRYRCARSDHLRNHIRKHANERSFKCTLCKFSSKFSSGLSKHTKQSHPDEWRRRRRANAQKTAGAVKEEILSESEDVGETTELEIDEDGKMLFIRKIGRSATKETLPADEIRSSLRQRLQKKIMPDFVDGEEFDEGGFFEGDEDVDLKVDNVYEGEEQQEELEESEEDEVENERVIDERLNDEEIVEDEEDFTTYARQDDDFNDDEDEDNVEEDSQSRQSSQIARHSPPKDLLSSYVIYQCIFCEFSCEMRQGLMQHLSSHMESWSFTCKVCNFSATSPADLQAHSEDHKYEGENGCSYCDYVASSKIKLKRHIEKRHPPGQPMACTYCDYISSDRRLMKTHIMGHKSKRVWQCLICSYKASFRSSLKRHLRKHTGERPYYCQHCEFNASQYSHLTRHLRRSHPDEPGIDDRPTSPYMLV